MNHLDNGKIAVGVPVRTAHEKELPLTLASWVNQHVWFISNGYKEGILKVLDNNNVLVQSNYTNYFLPNYTVFAL